MFKLNENVIVKLEKKKDINKVFGILKTKKESKLDKDSTILLNQIRTIDKLRIVKILSSANLETMQKVNKATVASLNLKQ